MERYKEMSITAKKLANILGVSPAAVSIALNNKPGVSDDTRQRILKAAKDYGYKYYAIETPEVKPKSISFVLFKKTGGAIIDDTPFFSTLTEGIARCCSEHGYLLDIRYIFENTDVESELDALISSGSSGIVLLATEMSASDFEPFCNLALPLVVLDTYFDNITANYVLINNVQGAFLATDTLINTRHSQPGYLRSSYPIGNFEERADGFYKAIRRNSLSPSASIVHRLSPSIEGAYQDMKQLLKEKVDIAPCYFADNDIIAAGAMRAFIEFGYIIPKDVAIIGFDNAYPNGTIDPPLTTIDVPKHEMGRIAVERVIYLMENTSSAPIKSEILTSLIQGETL